MEESAILEYFEGKTIFITGASGFLAKIFAEKMLRVQPNIKKLFLLIRASKKRSVEQRLEEEVINSELFRVLKKEYGSNLNSVILSKLVPVSGNASCENLGILNSQMLREMWQEIDIIVNSAATTRFDERYDVALGINTFGVNHIINFANNCSKLHTLLHVSTAYVNDTRASLIPEKPLRMGQTLDGSQIAYLDINAEKVITEDKLKSLMADQKTTSEKEIRVAMQDLGIERAKLHGWENTYSFTKAMGEMLLGSLKKNTNYVTTIIRPTIITSTYKDPFPGWTDEGGLRTLDSIFAAYGKGKLRMLIADPETTLDMIPGDMVVNCMMAAIAASHSTHHSYVYQIGSSYRNRLKSSDLKRLMHHYLTQNPLLDTTGKPIKVGRLMFSNTMDSDMSFLKVLKLINIISFNQFASVYENASRRMTRALRFSELYRPYLFSPAIFEDSNTEILRKVIKGNDTKMDKLNFDPVNIDWDDYFLNTHFPGVVKYALK